MFTIPNDSFAGTVKQRTQATPFQTDIDILVAGYGLTGTAAGCAVAAQASPDMTVAVTSGTVVVGGTTVAVGGGNVAITANAAADPRVDLVVASSVGAVSVVTGTPAASPALPALPASSAALAAVYVDAAAAAIANLDIVDKRVELPPSAVFGLIDRFSLGAGDLSVGVYQERMRSFSGSIELLGVSASCGFGHGPSGDDVVLDVLLENAGGGTSLWTLSPVNRPTILDGAEATAGESLPETTLILPTQSLRPSVISIGSTSPGSYCVMNIRWRWAA